MGRRKLTIVERLRVKLWYLNIKHRTGWSDYRLDLEFGQSVEDGKVDGPGRTRVFDVIRKKETLPSRGVHHRRQFDLVARVESHPILHGTQAIIDSFFWELLRLPPRDLDETTRFVEKCLDRLGLARVTGGDSFLWDWLVEPSSSTGSLKSTGSGPYERTLQRATNGLPSDLDLVALFGGLYREACLDFALENAEIAGILFRLSLENYFAAPWIGSTGALLVDIGINRILHGRIDYESSGSGNLRNQPLVASVSQGFIASRSDPLFAEFVANHEAFDTAYKCWVLSIWKPSDMRKLVTPLTDNEKKIIRELRKRGKPRRIT